MRSALASVNRRQRSQSILSGVPPSQDSKDYLPELAAWAASIVYKSPLPSPDGHPIFVVNAAAFPDTYEVDYDSLLPYVLARLPGEDDLIHGTEYEIIFFAGGQVESATQEKKQGPGIGWYLQAYNVLSRAMRKRLQKLYIVHPRTFVRVLVNVFSTVVSPKFRKKIVNVSNLSALEKYTPIANLLIPPAVYLHDRKLEDEIDTMINGLVFGTRHPLPKDIETGHTRLPRLLRETSKFLLANVTMEGLFRVSPHAILTDVLQEAYDRGQKFIVWKDVNTSMADGIDKILLDEITSNDAYGAHVAAALIKAWYRELRDPIFPESTYTYLRSSLSQDITLDDLVVLLDPKSATSVLTTTSREILIRHLVPLLANVAQHEVLNKMTATNLAICFGMALLRGSDQMEDAKMTGIVKTVIESAIRQWSALRQRLGLTEEMFLRDIEAPEKSRLYEDPLPELTSTTTPHRHVWTHRRLISVDDDNKKESTLHIPRSIQRLPLISRAQEPKDPPPTVPKRKPAPSISNGGANVPNRSHTTPPPELLSSIQGESIAKVPKRKAVLSDVPPSEESTGDANVSQSDRPLAHTTEEVIFRKPLAPASASRRPSQIASLAKPVLPGIQLPSVPNTNTLTSPSFPKPRMPSPGLLQRMNTIERLHNEKTTSPEEDKRQRLEPGKLSLKKASVDDLRRLYEDRLSTVQGLERATILQRSYSQS